MVTITPPDARGMSESRPEPLEEPQGPEGRSTVMAELSPKELERIARNVEDWRRLSDNLFRVGPLKVGLDGMLTWFPGLGDVYGLGASGYLLVQASRVGASNETLTRMALLLGADAVVGAVPIVGDVFDLVFRAHARSALILLDHIRERQKAALPAPEPKPARRETPYARPTPPPPPAPPPEPPAHTQEDEWAQARRVEELRAQVRDRGGGIVRPRP